MDSQEGLSRPRQSASSAAAALNRRRAFLQNFTPAFNIGPQAQRGQMSNVMAAASRQSAAGTLAQATAVAFSPYVARRTKIVPEMTMHHEEDEPIYGDQLDEEEIGESEPDFDEEEINDEDVGHVELDGVDIDEVEEVQAEEIDDMEALDEEEEMDIPVPHYDSRYASQDEYMYDNEVLEEEFSDDELASSSFDQRNLADIQGGSSSFPIKSKNSSQWNESSSAQGIGKERMREDDQDEPEEWMSDEEFEELDEAPPTVSKAHLQLPLRQAAPDTTPQRPMKVKPIISPDICDGTVSRSYPTVPTVRQQVLKLLNDDSGEDSDDIRVEVDPMLECIKGTNATSQQSSAIPGRTIRLSFAHASPSPEKRPKRVPMPTQEGSDDDSNDFGEDSNVTPGRPPIRLSFTQGSSSSPEKRPKRSLLKPTQEKSGDDSNHSGEDSNVTPARLPIRLSFTHDSSSSPEKRPKRALTPTKERSDDDSNDYENDTADTQEEDSPKKSRVSRESTTKRRVGRPKKPGKYEGNDDDDSQTLESADDSKDALETSRTSTARGTRRTARARKPTKRFVINFGGRSSSSSASPRKGQDKGTDDKDRSLTITVRNVGDAVPRGRGSNGRTRGRPKGSTAKLRTHATACMGNIVQEVMNKSTDDLETQSGPHSDTEADSQVKGPKISSRGGRRERAPKVPKEKNNRVSKSKLPDILDENAMMGYTKTRDEFDNSVDGESINLGDDDTRFSNSNNMNSPANSNLDSTGLKIKKQKNAPTFLAERKPVTAETLFDYWWTRDGKSERFVLQEQISEFLGITSFKRKYPDLKRRVVDMEERMFLQKEKVVTEVQCDLGLTPLYFDDVIPILRQDFHSKYLELEEVWSQRMQLELERKKNETRPVERSPIKMRPEDVRKTLLLSTAEWNSAMNRDRQIHRSRAMDLQTLTIHEQIGRTQKFILPPEKTKVGYFPKPVLIGHFVDEDCIPTWTSEELKYLPLNTPVYGPVVENTVGDSEDSESDSDDSSTTDDTSSSSDLTGKQEPSSDTDDNASATDNVTPLVVGGENNLGGPEGMNVVCKSCSGGIMNNKDAVPEMIIHCTKCKVPNHPSCLELSLDMLPFILKYNWQCTDCKNCIECNDPADEDKMLFCDLCDRGYHIYCVGLRKVPTGRWHCRVCAVCYSCGAKTPSEEDRLAEWYHEFKRGEKNSKFYLHSHCVNCHKLFKKGHYCPSCLKVHQKFDRSDKSLTECRTCEKWVHAECAKSKPVTSGTMFGFRCDACEAAFKIRTKIRTPFGSCP